MIAMAVDPGRTTGAVAWRDAEGKTHCCDMPPTPHDFACLVQGIGPDVCYLEHQQAFPGQGNVSTGKLLQHYGELIGVLAALQISTAPVIPREWKKHYRLSGKDKEASRAAAQQRFPTQHDKLGRKKDHGRAEALLILLYGISEIEL